mgnify:CR=1 FL=1
MIYNGIEVKEFIYNGIEFKEFTSDEQVAFNPPKKMLVWDENTEAREDLVYAYIPKRFVYKVIGHSCAWQHCAEIPEEPKPRRATNLELMKWLAKGNGFCQNVNGDGVWASHEFDCKFVDSPCGEHIQIRKWDDDEWHEPTADYMGLEDLA